MSDTMRSGAPRRLVTVAIALALAALIGACSISAEQQPRPINRETTVAPGTSAVP